MFPKKRDHMAQAASFIVWTGEMRTVLYLLNFEFDFSPLERATIFISLFAEQLPQNKLHPKDLSSTLISQWRSRTDERSEARWEQWQAICSQRCSRVEEELRSKLTLRIKRVAQRPSREDPSEDPLSGPRTTVTGSAFHPTSRRGTLWTQVPVAVNSNQDRYRAVDPDLGSSRKRRKTSHEDTLRSQPHRQDISNNITVSRPTQKETTSNTKPKRSLLPKRPYPRPGDKHRRRRQLQLTEEEHQRAKEELTPVDEARAHPPLAPLLYRFWAELEEDGNYNSRTGFLSRRHGDCVRMPTEPLLSSQLDWIDVQNHINRKKIRSPFISVTNAFWWAIRESFKILLGRTRRGLKYTNRFKRNLRISVIDSNILDPNGVYHALPYHTQLKKKYDLDEGAQFYCGSHEFLVWREIPGNAIIRTLNITDIIGIAHAITSGAPHFRFGLICKAAPFKTKCIRELRQSNVVLNDGVTSALAKLATFFGIGIDATAEQTSHFVADVVQGFGIRLPHYTAQEWARLASVFEIALVMSVDEPIFLRDQSIKKAFLDGVRLGNSSKWNTLMDTTKLQAMQRKAKKIGLEDTARILCDEMDAAKLQLRLQETRYQRMLQSEQLTSAGPSEQRNINQSLTYQCSGPSSRVWPSKTEKDPPGQGLERLVGH